MWWRKRSRLLDIPKTGEKNLISDWAEENYSIRRGMALNLESLFLEGIKTELERANKSKFTTPTRHETTTTGENKKEKINKLFSYSIRQII